MKKTINQLKSEAKRLEWLQTAPINQVLELPKADTSNEFYCDPIELEVDMIIEEAGGSEEALSSI